MKTSVVRVLAVALMCVFVGGCKKASRAVGVSQPHAELRADSSVHGPTQPSGAPADAGTPSENIITSPCLSPGAVAAANTTGRLLVALEHLMDGFGPPGDTFRYGQPGTTERAENAARHAHQQVVQEWNEQVRSVAWNWDPQWQSRPPGHGAVYGCWTGSWVDDRGRRRPAGWSGDVLNREFCTNGGFSGEWRIRVPEAINYYVNGRPVEPELNRRIRTDGSVHPEQDQSCIALNAALDHGSGLVTCLGGQGLSSFQIRVPQEAVSPGGVLANLGGGNLIRIHGHQILRKTAGHWQWDEVPLSGISVAETARDGCSLPPPPTTVYPVVTQIGQEVTFPLVWSSGGNTFVGLRTYVGHDARRTITPITVSVTGTEVSGDGVNLTVRWTALTTGRNVRFVCSDRRLFAGQGIMLQLPDGNRVVPIRAGGPHPRPNHQTDGSCGFHLPQPLANGTVPAGYKLIYVPADNLPGWWQDEFGGLPRPRAVLEVSLASGSGTGRTPTPTNDASSGGQTSPGASWPPTDDAAERHRGGRHHRNSEPHSHHSTRTSGGSSSGAGCCARCGGTWLAAQQACPGSDGACFLRCTGGMR